MLTFLPGEFVICREVRPLGTGCSDPAEILARPGKDTGKAELSACCRVPARSREAVTTLAGHVSNLGRCSRK
ncbi:hypothetical protein GCM10010234_25450 [Streptomyces hawaiiensis]